MIKNLPSSFNFFLRTPFDKLRVAQRFIIIIAFTFLLSFNSNAQFANSWINYSQNYYKIKVWQDGMYRIDNSVLQTAGVPSQVTGNRLHLYYRGQEVPLYVTTAAALGSSDYIEFYGLRNDGGADAPLYDSAYHQPNDMLSLFTDTSAYYLTYSFAPNTNQYVTTANNIGGHPAKENYCWYTSTIVYGGKRINAFFNHGRPGIQGQQIFDSDFSNAEGYMDIPFNYTASTRTIATPYPYTAGPRAQFKTQWSGKFPSLHQMRISMANTQLVERIYFGFYTERLDTLLPDNNFLTHPTTAIVYSTAANPVPLDYNGIAYIQVKYPREFNFDNTSSLPFALNASNTSQYIEIYNFNRQGTTPVLYDITNRLRLEAVISNDTLKFLLPPSLNERKMVLVTNNTTVITPVTTIKPLTFTDYSKTSAQGDFIIIYNQHFKVDSLGNDAIEALKLVKNNNGFKAVGVDIAQLYDQFGYGNYLSPVCIRNFSDFVLSKWTSVPQQKYMLMLGKAIEYWQYNDNVNYRQYCYVPTWGYPGSDILLTAQQNNPIPRIPIGRLSILFHAELNNYTDKLSDYYATRSLPQSIENKLWTKRVVHLAGGENANDQAAFQYILNSYATEVEDSVSVGGKTKLFSKNSTDPISLAESSEMDSLIRTGVSLITFFGHSSFQSLDFNLNNPYNYRNEGRYPVILTNGCLVGNLFLPSQGLADQFTFARRCGSIGFLAPSSFSVSNALQSYTDAFYRHYTALSYNKPVGTIVQKTMEVIMTTLGDVVDKTVAEQMLYEGDPSILIGTHEKPDYILEPQSIFFTPGVVTAGIDTFKINVIVTNVGKALNDSLYIDITRILPDGSQVVVAHAKEKSTYYIDTFSFKVGNNYLSGLGLNQFNIKVDATDHTDELAEWNNSISATLVIQANDIIPVYPYEFSIVNTPQLPLVLKASTVDPFIKSGHYVFQMDTTENFNSPLLKTQRYTANGGLITWKPVLTLKDSTVYYWRTSIDTTGSKPFNWHTSSFIYLAASTPGWNQSHYYQFKKDTYTNIDLGTNRRFSFVNDVKTISVYDGLTNYVGGPLNQDEPSYYLNNVRMANWTCGLGVTLMFAVIDSATGIQWLSKLAGTNVGQYGDIHCFPNDFNCFFFGTGGPNDFAKVSNFIDSIPNGDYVMAMSINNPGYANFDATIRNAFHKLGAQKLDTVKGAVPYVLFSKKGSTTYPVHEIVGASKNSIIDTSFKVIGKWDKGYVESTQIGPAESWQSLHWKVKEKEANDETQLQLIGIKNDGTQDILVNNVMATDTSLSGISVNTYPFLKLRAYFTDTTNRTPPQLPYWRINHQAEPDLAISPNIFYHIKDTATEFSTLNLSYAVANVSEVNMYHVKVKYVITDATNTQHTVYSILDTVPALDTVHANLSYLLSSSGYVGANKMLIEINPYDTDHRPEQYHFNNLATLSFYVVKDGVNPLLDVTFDGMHILDGDIVSSKSEIVLRLRDESKKLALNDPAVFKIQLKYPDGTKRDMTFDGIKNEFIAADSTKIASDNTAKAIVRPDLLKDGTYVLTAQGYDRSGNPAGKYDYRVSFEVINKAMISNILNYPNPFTSSTRFVFTLTGSEVPEFMKIQVLTITGKVVKEIYQDELGPMHIGRNITEYAWDGSDQYGSPLANGLYLYRVVTRLDTKDMDRYETTADKFFKNGYGKMYLAR